jgi:hypothetical protein
MRTRQSTASTTQQPASFAQPRSQCPIWFSDGLPHFQHHLGLRHREGAEILVLGQQGHRVHHRQSGRLQRLRRRHSLVVSWARFIATKKSRLGFFFRGIFRGTFRGILRGNLLVKSMFGEIEILRGIRLYSLDMAWKILWFDM